MRRESEKKLGWNPERGFRTIDCTGVIHCRRSNVDGRKAVGAVQDQGWGAARLHLLHQHYMNEVGLYDPLSPKQCLCLPLTWEMELRWNWIGLALSGFWGKLTDPKY